VAGNPERPVPIDSLEFTLERGTRDDAELLAAFDSDGNGSIDDAESVLDSEAKVSRTRDLLVSLGYESPRIVGEIYPYAVNHNTTGAGWATRECESCHESESRLSHAVVLSSSFPHGVVPVGSENVETNLFGTIQIDESGRLMYEPESKLSGFYVLGHNAVRWANVVGFLAVVGVLCGVIAHAVLRWRASRASVPAGTSHATEVYMYTVYERFWHWLQALAIVILLATGIEIHFSAFDVFGFALAVRVHNIVGFIVVANALFAALYHVASGEIRHYLPEPHGFFGQAIDQARYYISGIFRGHAHPFEKTPERKLNPLQQLTYLSILNILLPLQILTGLLIWGAQRWEGIHNSLGGLTVVAPVHALGSWMFAAFLLLHVYLTTTGPTPTANIRAMLHGWERSESRKQVLERS
jgi:thiosulfate reductase cytochrome b subunit